MTNELYHHGIKGQKWGVRRYQNSDGSLTEEGRKRQNLRRRVSQNIKTTDDANRIVRSLSTKEKDWIGPLESDEYITEKWKYEAAANLAKRILIKNGDVPVSMFEIWDNRGKDAYVSIATDSNYRGQGNALKAAQSGLDWYNKYGKKKIDNLYWSAAKDNVGSISLAKKLGFSEVLEKDKPSWAEEYAVYRYDK